MFELGNIMRCCSERNLYGFFCKMLMPICGIILIPITIIGIYISETASVIYILNSIFVYCFVLVFAKQLISEFLHRRVEYSFESDRFVLIDKKGTEREYFTSECSYYIVQGFDSYLELYLPNGKNERIYHYVKNKKEFKKYLDTYNAIEVKTRDKNAKKMDRRFGYTAAFLAVLELVFLYLM